MDSTTDNSYRTLWGIMKVASAPDYVKSGSLVDRDDAKGLPSGIFADVANRRFPLTDRANIWASAGYFAKTASDCGYTAAESDMVRGRIMRAAEVWDIGKDVEEVMSKIASPKRQVKAASDDMSAYCDPENMGYPVFDKTGAEKANEFFSANAYKYGHARRMSIAKNIMRKCAEYGVPVSEQVRMSAGDGFPNREALAEHLYFRVDELRNRGINKMAAMLCKLAQEVCCMPDEDLFKSRNGLFDAIGAADEMAGIDGLYNTRFYAPEEVVFDITPQSMKDIIDDAVPMGRETFSAKALAGLPRSLFDMVLPKESVDGMMENGKLSPNKLSITIVGLKPTESAHLLKVIKDFTGGLMDVDEDNPEGEDDKKPEKGDEDGKDEESGKGEKGE